MSTDSAPAPRRDAARNRGLLIGAALEIFARDGLHAPLDRVAERAGLSRATLYRHFPDRDALWDAVVTAPLSDILHLARRAAAASDPREGLIEYLAGVGRLESGPTGFAGIMTTRFTPGSRLAALRESVQEEVDEVVGRAARTVGVRSDLAETDLALASIALAAVVEGTRAVAPDAWRRLLRLLLEGVLEPTEDHNIATPPVLDAPPLRRNEVWRSFSA